MKEVCSHSCRLLMLSWRMKRTLTGGENWLILKGFFLHNKLKTFFQCSAANLSQQVWNVSQECSWKEKSSEVWRDQIFSFGHGHWVQSGFLPPWAPPLFHLPRPPPHPVGSLHFLGCNIIYLFPSCPDCPGRVFGQLQIEWGSHADSHHDQRGPWHLPLQATCPYRRGPESGVSAWKWGIASVPWFPSS